MAGESFWRRRAPIWLRILIGLLLVPVIYFGLAVLITLLLPAGFSGIALLMLAVKGVVAAVLSWLVVRELSARAATGLGAFALLGCVLLALISIPSYQAYKPGARLPEFPWPPPAASASYVLPETMLEEYETVGEVTDAILSALETNGYVERSFFRTQDGGVALVTRLERINEDGSSVADTERWPTKDQNHASSKSLYDFLHGLFFVDPGRYRVIVFVLQDLPFSQSSEEITANEARAWLRSGANVLPPQIATRPLGGAQSTALIYEFASDGKDVRVVESDLTGKNHLEKAGVLAELDTQ